MRSEGYGACLSVCLSVSLSVHASSRTTGYKAANECHQRLLNNENIVNNVAIFHKRLCSRDGVKTSEKANVRSIAHSHSTSLLAGYAGAHAHVSFSPEHAHVTGQAVLLECLPSVSFDLCSLCSQWITTEQGMSAM